MHRERGQCELGRGGREGGLGYSLQGSLRGLLRADAGLRGGDGRSEAGAVSTPP